MRCNIADCKYPELVGDGYCHDQTNNFQCGFDGGDCCLACTSKVACKECRCITGNAGLFKTDSLNGNGFCNDEANNDECGYDGGDCCSNVNTEYCSTCTCFHQKTCAAGFLPSIVGDGFCNDETNNEECNYDGGDCCELNINTELCFECVCYQKGACAAGFIPSIVGDGFCNDETNNAECNYDGGDCCELNMNTELCFECLCYVEDTCAAGFIHPLAGDGFCNDETNNVGCNFDGGDCCKPFVNRDLCLKCECRKLKHLQLCRLKIAPLLNKHYRNEGTLSREEISLKCFQILFYLNPFAPVSGISNEVLCSL